MCYSSQKYLHFNKTILRPSKTQDLLESLKVGFLTLRFNRKKYSVCTSYIIFYVYKAETYSLQKVLKIKQNKKYVFLAYEDNQ